MISKMAESYTSIAEHLILYSIYTIDIHDFQARENLSNDISRFKLKELGQKVWMSLHACSEKYKNKESAKGLHVHIIEIGSYLSPFLLELYWA